MKFHGVKGNSETTADFFYWRDHRPSLLELLVRTSTVVDDRHEFHSTVS